MHAVVLIVCPILYLILLPCLQTLYGASSYPSRSWTMWKGRTWLLNHWPSSDHSGILLIRKRLHVNGLALLFVTWMRNAIHYLHGSALPYAQFHYSNIKRIKLDDGVTYVHRWRHMQNGTDTL
ncbi:hypothetical protein CPB84DRAFT_1369563 [Gymnopilus junonius]|uniref:Secreted protein n=1 Tax=Gymnopilus junonius TaxID=109634 RepID=A0A9P5NJA4_GYMJU|nr:hypothetical protein CPB84DRAFT_1369563 [Gymnopilus junonius]